MRNMFLWKRSSYLMHLLLESFKIYLFGIKSYCGCKFSGDLLAKAHLAIIDNYITAGAVSFFFSACK
ncbi:Uncharacterized protein TCM_021340 [Theobroma cacao]|uniref:Uncharacterized protein n=1 Tax=Theobroma cacao TaxID=3641 RepID=A0A061EQS5_THECC|nr:Uncharacterized protein TCM_021340 [Theobroma cacao]